MTEILEVRSLMAPIPGSGVLLPGSLIAEVISFSDPAPFTTGPSWLLGEIRWNGWQIPIVNLATLAGTSADDIVGPRNRVLVVKTLSMSASVLHIGIVISGLPKLKNITAANLLESGKDMPDEVFSEVLLGDDTALIPDLDALADSIEKAVYTH
jgi:chemosensory pili system protein ChpC